MSCETRFLENLRERGFRLTPQREMVLSVLHGVEGVATAEEIYCLVQARSSAIDISTVYRTLDLLTDMGLASSVETGEGQRRYELVGVHGPHLHLVCSRCGSVAPAELHLADALARDLLACHDFVVDLSQLTVPGVCRTCAGQGS
jgi:Fur family ferric uptake transcriptional regulator